MLWCISPNFGLMQFANTTLKTTWDNAGVIAANKFDARALIIFASGVFAISFFVIFFAEYEVGFSYCGKGTLTRQSVGFPGRGSQAKTFQIDTACPLDGSSAGNYSRLSTFFEKSAVIEFDGEGTARVFVKKNGVVCDEQTVTGKGKFTAKASCR